MAEEEKIAEAVSEVLKRKEELRPVGKELIKALLPETRKKAVRCEPFRTFPRFVPLVRIVPTCKLSLTFTECTQ